MPPYNDITPRELLRAVELRNSVSTQRFNSAVWMVVAIAFALWNTFTGDWIFALLMIAVFFANAKLFDKHNDKIKELDELYGPSLAHTTIEYR